MTFKPRYTVFVWIFAFLISSYFTFWVETKWGVYFYLYIPIAIILSVVLFGTNLKGKLDISMRVIAAIFLCLGLLLARYFICCSGEQGGMGVLFVGTPVLGLTLLIYTLLILIQWFKTLSRN